MKVFRDDPSQRGFSLPCPLWKGQCTIHTSRHYPHVCREYKCKLLKEVIAERIPLSDALTVIEKAKEMIHGLKALLPVSANPNFRERLVAQLEQGDADLEFRLQADALLTFYEETFGVTDLIDKPDTQSLL
jgi:hypothetical protein